MPGDLPLLRGSGSDHTVLAGTLGCVGCCIGAADQGIERFSRRLGNNAGTEAQEVIVPRQRLTGELAAETGNRRFCIGQRRIRQQQDELLTTKTAQHIGWSHRLAQNAHQMNERLVADLVTQRVVKLLEIIEIDQGERQPGIIA